MGEKQLVGAFSYDPEEEIVHRDSKTGQIMKITRLPRSHPKMEAKYGERRYKEKPVETDLGQMKEKYDEMYETVATLKAQLAVKEVAEPESQESPKVDIATLRKRAKKIDPTLTGNASRAKCEKIISDFFDEGDEDGEIEA